MACAPGTCGCDHDRDGHQHGGHHGHHHGDHDGAREQPTDRGASCCGGHDAQPTRSDPHPAERT